MVEGIEKKVQQIGEMNMQKNLLCKEAFWASG